MNHIFRVVISLVIASILAGCTTIATSGADRRPLGMQIDDSKIDYNEENLLQGLLLTLKAEKRGETKKTTRLLKFSCKTVLMLHLYVLCNVER